MFFVEEGKQKIEDGLKYLPEEVEDTTEIPFGIYLAKIDENNYNIYPESLTKKSASTYWSTQRYGR